MILSDDIQVVAYLAINPSDHALQPQRIAVFII